jgi:hypothetical protein
MRGAMIDMCRFALTVQKALDWDGLMRPSARFACKFDVDVDTVLLNRMACHVIER